MGHRSSLRRVLTSRDGDSTPVLRGVPTVLGNVVLLAVTLPLFRWLEAQGLVLGAGWALALLVALAGLTATGVVQRTLGGGSLKNRPVLRLFVGFAVYSTIALLAGWSFLLPASALIVAVPHIQRSGSGVWRPAVVVVTVFTALSELAVQAGWIENVLDAPHSHVAALGLLVVSSLGIANVGLSVAEREGAADALARTEARLRALMDSSTDVLTVSDADGRLTYVSPAVERAMGHSARALVGTPLLDLVDSDYRTGVSRRLQAVVETGAGARTRLDVLVAHTSGERRWYEWTVHNLLADPLVRGLVVDQRDVTDRLLHQGALAHAAAHDDLTGLANRGELMRRLAASLPQAAPGAGVAVLFMDLDRFKAVNDTYGHAAGDDLLVVVARRLAEALRPHDYLARLGGDEFCAILTEIGSGAEVAGVAERLAAAVREPVALTPGVISVGVSVGWVLTTDAARDPARLFAEADAAMYRVKSSR